MRFGVHMLDFALGGIAEKRGVVNGCIVIREYLSLPLMFDHDMIDGAPATRFAARFKKLIKCGYGLDRAVQALHTTEMPATERSTGSGTSP